MDDLDGRGSCRRTTPTTTAPAANRRHADQHASRRASRWQEITLGENWKPNLNVTLPQRNPLGLGPPTTRPHTGGKPFADGSANGQCLWGNDLDYPLLSGPDWGCRRTPLPSGEG